MGYFAQVAAEYYTVFLFFERWSHVTMAAAFLLYNVMVLLGVRQKMRRSREMILRRDLAKAFVDETNAANRQEEIDRRMSHYRKTNKSVASMSRLV